MGALAGAAVLVVVGCARPSAEPAPATPVLRFVDVPGEEGSGDQQGAVEVTGLAPEVIKRLDHEAPTQAAWASCFAIHTVRDDGALGALPVAGRYEVAAGTVRFSPRFPPVPGMTYRARLDVGCWTRLPHDRSDARAPSVWKEAIWTMPEREEQAPRVVAVFPSTAVVPANLLKVYIHFSAPMARGDAYDHVRLIEVASETEVESPFLALGEELWDHEHRRFTLFFDPGRIKRGLRPHHEAGPPLDEGKRYRLEIASTWRSAAGVPLEASYTKGFMVGPDDRDAPSVAKWTITAPSESTTEPLVVTLPEALDHALLSRVLRVQHANGRPVNGQVEVTREETVWRWVPAAKWVAGTYEVVVETILEDLAGNNLQGVFDRDLATDGAPSVEAATVSVRFEVTAGAHGDVDETTSGG